MNPIIFALRRPYTVMVLVVAVTLGGVLAALRTPVDVFPNLNLPIIYVAQPYGGMDPAQMEGLLTNYYEYHFLYIGGIHHVESRNVQGMALMKLFFHPGTNMAQAMAETIGYVTRARAFMPPGTVSPFVTRFDGGSVPVGYLVLSSATRSIGEIQDQALFKVRPMFASLPGVSAPPPFGGNQRTVVVRLDPERLHAYRMSPDEVIEALTRGNAISPSGNVRIGDSMPIVKVNALVRQVGELNAIAIRAGANPTVYLRDVATVSDASDIPAGYALVDGRRAVYILVTKRADASTLSVVQNVRAALPNMQAVLPDDIRVSFEFDQSPTVTRAVRGLATEGLLGAGLTGLMVLLFLRDWRSALIVVLNIPFALLGAVLALWLTGQTINLMTLGGLALAIGILVDEATVEIENIHHKLETVPSVSRAVRMGNLDTAVPRLLALLCILAVFVPSFFLTGAARALFAPLSLAVGFAMATSYLLSSTFVPVLSAWLLRPISTSSRLTLFDRFRSSYGRGLRMLVRLRWAVVPAYFAIAVGLVVIVGRGLGLEIFPRVDSGRFQLRMRAPTGTRIERTEQVALAALATLEALVPPHSVAISVGYVGNIPSSYPINAIYQWTGGPEEVVLRMALKPGAKVAIDDLTRRLRAELAAKMPEVRCSFEPADIVSEVMSFGSATPVEVAINGPTLADNRAYAEKVRAELAKVPALRDLQFGQTFDYPTIDVDLDRERIGRSGVTVAEVARSLVAATSSSRFVVPNYWPDPKSGIGYQVQIEIPYALMRSIDDVAQIPIQRPGDNSLLLRDVATLKAGIMPGEYDRYNMKRVVSLSANVVGSDLGRVAAEVAAALKRVGEPPKGVTVEVRGQIAPLRELLTGLSVGLALAVVAILLLLTANFQSVRLALVVIATAPAVLAGVVVSLALTGTTINVQSFMGAIMAVGVAVANGILLVTFAERRRREGLSAVEAALDGAAGRLRPILMTSAAMIAGMVPLALAVGEGGEQSAPLGRAVIGGLAAATLATLGVLPALYSLVQGRATRRSVSLDPDDPESPRHDPGGIHGEPNPNGTAAVKTATLGLVLLAAFATSGCARAPEAAAAPATAQVEVVSPVRATIRRVTDQPGEIVARAVTPIHAKISGFVDQYCVEIGDKVRQGQTLAVLAVPEIDAELAQKRALIEQAQAEHAQAEAAVKTAEAGIVSARAQRVAVQAGVKGAEADLTRWRSEFHRTEELFRERAMPGSMVDETRGKLQAAEAARDQVEAQVKAADAALMESVAKTDSARADVLAAASRIAVARRAAEQVAALQQYATIVAPFDGAIDERHVDRGHLTQPGAGATPLFVVSRTDVVTVAVAVPELFAASIQVGQNAEVRIQSLDTRPIAGQVTRASAALDPRTRTLRVEIDLPNTGNRLKPGQFAHAAIALEEHPDALTLPATALLRVGEKTYCVRIANGRAERVPVTLGLESGGMVELVAGIDDKAVVVKANPAALVEGQSVEGQRHAQR